jgi:N-acetylglutamate synthase-like GNAT family acetyltransferase
MNTQRLTPSTLRQAQGRPEQGRGATRVRSLRAGPVVTLRAGTAADAQAIHALIEAHLVEGRLLPRSRSELAMHASRFLVAVRDASVVGCAELAPLSGEVAEVRSLVVDRSARTLGIGRQLIDELRVQAVLEGFERLCAFTHDAGYFARKGFSIVPHDSVPEKIALDCVSCALFRKCGQHAMMLSLDA